MVRKKHVWSEPERQALETMLRDAFPVSRISAELGVSTQTLYAEIKKGVTAEEYRNRQYGKYTAKKSVETQMEAYRNFLRDGYSKGDE